MLLLQFHLILQMHYIYHNFLLLFLLYVLYQHMMFILNLLFILIPLLYMMFFYHIQILVLLNIHLNYETKYTHYNTTYVYSKSHKNEMLLSLYSNLPFTTFI